MSDVDDILNFVERFVQQASNIELSDLQRRILIASVQEDRITYDQLAEECGYSARYIKQDVAPKFWHMVSEALHQKVTKTTARAILEQAMGNAPAAFSSTAFSTAPLSITAAPSPIPPITAPIPQTATLLNGPSFSEATILLVDDQPKNLRLLSGLLEEQGYGVRQALNGKLALQSVAADLPDLILLDIRMPDMDGYIVCQQLKTNPATQHIPIIFVSAMDESWDKVKAFSVGGSDYITKPFKVVEVLARVENQLKIQQLQQTLKAQNLKLQQAVQALQKSVDLDPLTQVASRSRLDMVLPACWQQSTQGNIPLFLMLAQVDNFNFYSPGGNQAQGDQCLYQVGQCLQQTIQATDGTVGRYATLTFGIIFSEPTDLDGQQMAQKLLSQIQSLDVQTADTQTPNTQTLNTDSELFTEPLTLSIGMLTVLPGLELTEDRYWQICEQNLQTALLSGGNCVIS
ncbi:MAG: response regulator [Cyanobacteria bacterium J06560_5]